MIDCMKGEGDETPPRNVLNNSFGGVFVPNSRNNVVIVMDALKDFSPEPLRWALDHVVQSRARRCSITITLLGVMPWIPLPLLCKTWLDVWTFDEGDLSALSELKMNDHKYHKIRGIIELCDQKGVDDLFSYFNIRSNWT
ncbi:uncharacterized protein LOC126686888 [Mercurialis annua]|uniref:uncharacterized protein LOC126686888 n=1 Tax=Mercurialis annua TaxID=3986 RepID=UPI0021607373|nr:uncharacterized protein LOC126686888 [Mercurialis annua]